MLIVINGRAVDTSSAALPPLHRAVIISIFTWRRAEPDDDADEVMGFWGDTFPTVTGDKIGSRLWLLRRQKITSDVLRRARMYVDEALKWLIDDGVVTSITTSIYRTNNDAVVLSIHISHKSGAAETLSLSDFWRLINVGI